ncbi:hypothetical protein AMS68_000159 [Peltaster fructicola]|uniref:YMC020W-like alpha/beta hydrolase domain-containing protein n=1 Tax=Peltaster fructicola TaxID=286661 RepID=A0A6H0XIU8_9PEZI|nr:hypothetical protein AMS68_000159 [Peltaster fructicola]
MAPKNVDQKTSVSASKDSKSNDQSSSSTTSRLESASTPKNPAASETSSKDNIAQLHVPSRDSWYSGTWRTKSSPLTATAKESVSVEQGVTSEALEKQRLNGDTPKRPGYNVSRSMRGSRKSIPLAAEPSRIHATSDATSQSRPRHDSEEKLRTMDSNEAKAEPADSETRPVGTIKSVAEDVKSIASTVKPQATAWLGGFWSRPDGYASDSEKMREGTKRRKLDDASSMPLPPTPQQEIDQPVLAVEAPQQQETTPAKPETVGTGRSWFGMWSNAQNQHREEEKKGDVKADESVKDAPQDTAPTDEASTVETPQKPDEPSDNDNQQRSSGWAFWSYERPKELVSTPNGTQKQLGEIAVADTPSQSHPEAAQFNEQRQKAKLDAAKAGALPSAKRARNSKSAEPEAPAVAAASQTTITLDDTPVQPEETKTNTQRGKARRLDVPNTVSPMFEGMYPSASNSGYVEKLARYLAQTLYIPGTSSPESQRHVLHKVGGLPKIKKAIAIGVHGFFPAPLLQRVLGPPTGTSIRFANYAAAAVSEWCKKNQPEVKEVEIEKVALEGEGFIADRVNTLWKLLLNWLDHLRQADFVMVACHSQGVPVAIMLVAKLIQLGVLSAHAKIGVCAMAGINLGPFLEYRSRLFAGSALELFDFCDSGSKVSKSYFESVDICLRHGVRISYIGSLDDQLVSLESSLFAPLSHPYVHRATFIDGRLHSPSFLTHLVIFALKLRNLGISDHGLLRELSAPLAGSLMGGEGHSRIYDDPAVYGLAIDFALESTDVDPAMYAAQETSNDKEKAKQAAFSRRSSVSGFPTSTAAANSMRRGSMSAMGKLPGIGAVIAQYEPLVSGANSNPFYLPWAVRGMLEEDMVKRDMRVEVKELVEEFDAWKPQSKVLKDVRWRLEGVKSML